MINAADAVLHAPDPAAAMWAETNFFAFSAPELDLNGHVYCLFRPNQGVCLTTVAINDRWCKTPWDANYVDLSMHVPMGENFDLRQYSLSSGVSVRCLEPVMKYEVSYDDGAGTKLAFQFDALAPGYDIHDPDLDPMVAAQTTGSDYAWGTAYNGHYDQTGYTEGEVTVDGRTIPFSCIATRDHSWGPRAERHPTTLSWMNGAICATPTPDRNPDLVFHALCDFDDSTGGADIRFTHGYVIVNGTMIGLSGGGAKTRRDGFQPVEVELELQAPAGRSWNLHGEARNAFPWQAWPNVTGFNSLMRWTYDGRVGYGEIYDFYGLQRLNQLTQTDKYPFLG
jgi:hypothetical protein